MDIGSENKIAAVEMMPSWSEKPEIVPRRLHISDHPKGLRRGKEKVVVHSCREGAEFALFQPKAYELR